MLGLCQTEPVIVLMLESVRRPGGWQGGVVEMMKGVGIIYFLIFS